MFVSYRKISKQRLKYTYAVAGTLTNKDYYQTHDSAEHGQWRALSIAFYPPQYKFPTYDIAVVVSVTMRTKKGINYSNFWTLF